mmetsp:Transcript_44196/g.122897  ORF Transcript_44196/g.122897 Transcript_44196/m.122897 type:complete len:201 (-) Transcript_44196:722-1324(-)
MEIAAGEIATLAASGTPTAMRRISTPGMAVPVKWAPQGGKSPCALLRPRNPSFPACHGTCPWTRLRQSRQICLHQTGGAASTCPHRTWGAACRGWCPQTRPTLRSHRRSAATSRCSCPQTRPRQRLPHHQSTLPHPQSSPRPRPTHHRSSRQSRQGTLWRVADHGAWHPLSHPKSARQLQRPWASSGMETASGRTATAVV